MVDHLKRARRPRTLREGIKLGLLSATAIWLWLVIVDALAGQPLRTFSLLGGVALFTVLHYALNVVYGVAAVSVVHGARREPTLLVGAALVFLLMEIGFAMLSALLAQVGLGELAWVRIFGGSLLGGAITWTFLARRHPLRQEFGAADAAQEE